MKIYKHKDGRCNASGPQIKALREAAGLSQEQLSTLLRICKALNCKLSDIVTDEETAELLREYEQ